MARRTGIRPFSAGWCAGREEEAEAVSPQGVRGGGRLELGRDAESFEDVGGAAAGGDGAVAVLGDLSSSGSGDQCRGGGDVEGSAAVSAGAARVDDGGALVVGEREGRCRSAEGLGEAGDLGGGFAASGHGAEEGGELHLGGFVGENALHQAAGFGEAQGLAVLDHTAQLGTDRHET